MNFETILGYVILILIVILLAVVFNGVETYKKNKSLMSFMESINLTGIPVVTFYHNNKKYNFLLDTGANLSVINTLILKEFKYTKVNASSNLMGMEGNSQKVYIVNIDFNYKKIKFNEDFQVVDMSKSFGSIKDESGVRIDGILGSGFLQKNRYILDFNNLTAHIK